MIATTSPAPLATLLVDIGNSRVKAGLQPTPAAGRVIPLPAYFWREQPGGPAALFAAAWPGLAAPARICLANVAGPEVGQAFASAMAARFGLPVEEARTEAECLGLRIAYREPARLGVDRFLALLAAYAKLGGPVCVVDCGTALTLDAVDAQGRHHGGLIVPGGGLMRAALRRGTARLDPAPEGEPAGEVGLLGADTEAGIAAGTRHALAGLVERVLPRLAAELGTAPRCLLTGGEAAALLPLLSVPGEICPDLVLQGLALWLEARR